MPAFPMRAAPAAVAPHARRCARLVAETRLHPQQFIYPLFVVPGRGIREPIASLPGQFHLSRRGMAAAEARAAWEEGVRAVLLFGEPEEKDPLGQGSRPIPTARCSRPCAR